MHTEVFRKPQAKEGGRQPQSVGRRAGPSSDQPSWFREQP